MKTRDIPSARFRLASGLLALLLVSARAHADARVIQTLPLVPGWNAIHLEVLPDHPEASAVFAGLNVDSAWAYEDQAGTPEFVQEVTEQALSRAGWISWVPTNRVDAFQNDLHRVQVNRGYLVKLAGATPVTLSVTGRPSLRMPAWKPNVFNFRGLPVDPGLPPTFRDFFETSPAHVAGAGALQPLYRLSPAGVWTPVAPTDLMRSGEAYWVYCKGASEFVGPLAVVPERGDGLDFGASLEELSLTLVNLGASGASVTLRDLGGAPGGAFALAESLANLSLTWPVLPSTHVWSLSGRAESRERFAARRVALTSGLVETVWEITDGRGTRRWVPVSVARSLRLGGDGSPLLSGPVSHAGLWVGTATVNAISEAHSGPVTTNLAAGFTVQTETDAATGTPKTKLVPNSVSRNAVSLLPTPTGSDFQLRLLLHVDETGKTRLLKEVIAMWKDGVSTNDAQGNASISVPGHVVLVTDDSLVGQFTGVSSRDGVPVGRRISTAGFDFADNELPLAGDFEIGSSVVGTNTVSPTFSRNPFRHRYHPDHQQGFDIRRVIELAFSPAPPEPPPGYGESVLDGTYRETVTGLHRTNIVVGGSFRLTRVATTAVLNR